MGAQGAYWSTNSHIDMFDADLFVTQVAAMSQLTGELMLVELVSADASWGFLHDRIASLADDSFVKPGIADQQHNALLQKFDAMFEQVKQGAFKAATNKLQEDLRKHVMAWVIEEDRADLLNRIDQAILLLQNG
jgi:hypothetical protein